MLMIAYRTMHPFAPLHESDENGMETFTSMSISLLRDRGWGLQHATS